MISCREPGDRGAGGGCSPTAAVMAYLLRPSLKHSAQHNKSDTLKFCVSVVSQVRVTGRGLREKGWTRHLDES